MLTAGLVFAALAALLHVYIFVMESLTWTQPAHPCDFGYRPSTEAETTKPMAFNQGFYNLFLAIVTAVGIAAVALGHTAVGAALVLSGVGSMAAASLVLRASSPDKARAALYRALSGDRYRRAGDRAAQPVNTVSRSRVGMFLLWRDLWRVGVMRRGAPVVVAAITLGLGRVYRVDGGSHGDDGCRRTRTGGARRGDRARR